MKAIKTGRILMTVLGVAISGAPALAHDRTGQDPLPSIQVTGNTVVVSYADLNVADADGMAALRQRIDAATVSVCRYYRGRLQDPAVENDCRHVAKANAMSQFERNEGQQFAAMEGWVQLAQIRITAPTA